MKLYIVPGSPNCRKVEAVNLYLNLNIEVKALDFSKGEHKSAEFLAINPNGLVPAFEDGDLKLWESNAIMQYLADLKPGNDLFPQDPKARIDVIRWQLWDLAHFNKAAATITFERFFKPNFGMGETNESVVEAAIEDFHRFAPVLNNQLEKNRFVTGDNVTLADFSLASQSAFFEFSKVPMEDYSHISAWLQRLNEITAWAETAPPMMGG